MPAGLGLGAAAEGCPWPSWSVKAGQDCCVCSCRPQVLLHLGNVEDMGCCLFKVTIHLVCRGNLRFSSFLTHLRAESPGAIENAEPSRRESHPHLGNGGGIYIYIYSVQSLSCVRLFVTPWTAAHQATLSITNSQSLLKLMTIDSVMPSNHLILCCSLLLLPSIFPSIRVFSSESALCIRWPKYWGGGEYIYIYIYIHVCVCV